MCSYNVQLLSKVGVVFLTSGSFGLTVFSASYNTQSTTSLQMSTVFVPCWHCFALSTSNVSFGAKKSMEWVEVKFPHIKEQLPG